eukprot:scaffold135471_cov31-Tisochrysis_lutea.AAC.5
MTGVAGEEVEYGVATHASLFSSRLRARALGHTASRASHTLLRLLSRSSPRASMVASKASGAGRRSLSGGRNAPRHTMRFHTRRSSACLAAKSVASNMALKLPMAAWGTMTEKRSHARVGSNAWTTRGCTPSSCVMTGTHPRIIA